MIKLKLCGICKGLHDKREGIVARVAAPAPSEPEPSGCPVERSRNPAPARVRVAPAPAATQVDPPVPVEDCDLCGQTIRRIKGGVARATAAVEAKQRRKANSK